MVDPIADMLTRIRNAQAAKKSSVEIPFSKIKYGIAKILEQRGFIKKADFKGRKTKKVIEVELSYKDTMPRISGLRRISKPGQRLYASVEEVHPIRQGRGIRILSTSKGLITNREARKQNIGGEILCEIW